MKKSYQNPQTEVVATLSAKEIMVDFPISGDGEEMGGNSFVFDGEERNSDLEIKKSNLWDD